MAVLIFVPNAQPSRGLDDQPVVAQLQFYEPDTAQATPATVYTDAALTAPHPWPLVSDSSGNFPAIWAGDDAVYSVTWSTDDGQSASWDDIDGVATSYGALIAAAQAAKAGAVTAQGEAETAQTSAEAAQAAAEASEAAAAVILADVIAAGGNDGWSPILAIASDGTRRVQQVADWVGGGGTKPATGYVGATAPLKADIADGVDIRGPAGSATGDVTQDGLVTAGHIAAWTGTGLIEDGGVLGGMANLDLASQAEAEAGSSNTKGMSPLRVAQAIVALASASLPLLTKTANYQLLSADRGSLVSFTNSITLSFEAAATLGNNWFGYLYNAGTGDGTLDANGSETIDGLTSFVMYPGELRLVRCNGTGFTSYVLKGFSKAFTASGTFTKAPGYSDFEGEAWGGGGSGSTDAGGGGGGGGGGGCIAFKLRASALSASETVTIGTGGAAKTGSGAGNDGANTTLGTLVTAYGGSGSQGNGGGGGGGALGASVASPQGGAPRLATAANPGFGGGDGGSGGSAEAGYPSVYGGGGGGCRYSNQVTAGGASVYAGGGGGGACLLAANYGLGGASALGGAGGRGAFNANGFDGTAPGGGGGGCAYSSGTYASGAGARGELRIRGIT